MCATGDPAVERGSAADRAVRQLPEDVRVAGMAGQLLHEVHQDPAQGPPGRPERFVHGQPESNDPQFGCGNTGQPNAFPVINPARSPTTTSSCCRPSPTRL